MKYRCTACGHTGEQSSFLQPKIIDNAFSYTNTCPECGAANAFVLIQEESSRAGTEVDRRVDEIMARARDNMSECGASDKMLLTEEELSALKETGD